jgi:hypothetical protein
MNEIRASILKDVDAIIVIYESSARRHFSYMSALFEAQATKERVLHLRECTEYVFAHRGLDNIQGGPDITC